MWVAALAWLWAGEVASCAPSVWNPSISEFTASFAAPPKITESAAYSRGEQVVTQIAVFENNTLIERAEASRRLRVAQTSKEDAYTNGKAWADSTGLQYVEFSYDGSNSNDLKLIVKGTKDLGEGPQTIYAIWHWGRPTMFVQWVAESAAVFPSTEARRFLASFRSTLDQHGTQPEGFVTAPVGIQ